MSSGILNIVDITKFVAYVKKSERLTLLTLLMNFILYQYTRTVTAAIVTTPVDPTEIMTTNVAEKKNWWTC